MEIGRILDSEGELAYLIDLDETFLEFLADVVRGAKQVGSDKPEYPQDYQQGLSSTIQFGKYKGKTWKKVMELDPDYVEWAANNVDRIPEWFKKVLKGEDTDKF